MHCYYCKSHASFPSLPPTPVQDNIANWKYITIFSAFITLFYISIKKNNITKNQQKKEFSFPHPVHLLGIIYHSKLLKYFFLLLFYN